MQLFNKYKSFFKKIIQLSYPIVIGQLGIVLMGTADVIMVGKLESINLAAVSLANSIYFVICILGIGTLSAVSPLVAQSKGAEKPAECGSLFKQAIVAACILSIFICGIVYVLTQNLHWFGQSEKLIALTKNYLHLLNLGTLPLLIFIAIKQYSDGLGFTKVSAVLTLIALGINIILNWILIYGNWGAPALGLYGTGLATTISRVFMGIAIYFYVKKAAIYKPYLQEKSKEKEGRFLIQIFNIGFPSGLQYFFEVGAFAFAAIMIGWISESAMAAHQVAISIASITYMLATGISAGGSILVGDAVGRKNQQDLQDAGRAAILLGASFMGCCALLIASFAPFILAFYTNDRVVIDMAQKLLYIAAFFQLSDGIQCVSLGVLRGIGDTKIPTVITIISYWVIGIPLGYYLCFQLNWSLYGVWWALLFGLTFSALFLSIRFLRESKNINVAELDLTEFNLHAH